MTACVKKRPERLFFVLDVVLFLVVPILVGDFDVNTAGSELLVGLPFAMTVLASKFCLLGWHVSCH